MRILARANAHRSVLDHSGAQIGVEIASSPDTPARPDRWAWSVRLLDGSPQPAAAVDEIHSTTTGSNVAVRHTVGPVAVLVDPSVIDPDLELRRLDDLEILERAATDLLVLIVTTGQAEIERRHHLRQHDALVFEGDDPLSIELRPCTGAAEVAVVRLRSTQNATVNWVP